MSHSFVTNITYRNCSFFGNAPMKIKTWANTTGEISNILFEDCLLNNASSAVEISANYGGTACPCPWHSDYGGPEQRGTCKNYGPRFKGSSYWNSFVGIGGVCGPEGDTTNNINLKNITYRRLKGTVQAPGGIDCRKGNPCTITFEDVELKSTRAWECGNANITSIGSVTPPVPNCPVGPNDQPPY